MAINTVKIVKIWAPKNWAIILKLKPYHIYCRVMGLKDADRIASSVDPDQKSDLTVFSNIQAKYHKLALRQ